MTIPESSWQPSPRLRGIDWTRTIQIRGPYSSELADDHRSLGNEVGGTTDVPDEVVVRLSEIFAKGLSYAETYAVVLLVRNNSPGASYHSIHKRALELKPHLSNEVEEACASLLI